jgi:hypothetical protein
LPLQYTESRVTFEAAVIRINEVGRGGTKGQKEHTDLSSVWFKEKL